MNSSIILLPNVNFFEKRAGLFYFKEPLLLEIPSDLRCLSKCILESYNEFFSIIRNEKKQKVVRFFYNKSLKKEGYILDIDNDIQIHYAYPNGAFYALMTLRQLFLNEVVIKCKITDNPILPVRGYMLDVSRGKIPKIQSLHALADMLASFKINHLELYFEGSPFIYKQYEKYATSDSYTAKEIKAFDEYCKARFIELVPNLNTLGHMSAWLSHDEFKTLAEIEDGFSLNGHHVPPTTLDCHNPKSLDFALSLVNELTECFQSNCVNVGLDEPFELGKGKNLELTKKVGAGTLYAEYVNKLYYSLKNKRKTMMMWGDMVFQHAEVASLLEQDIVLLDWGYQAEYPFESHAKILSSLNKKFLLCPGTSSWNSISGMTDNMLINIKRASKAAIEYGALGIILTDWGDGGHIQHNFVSYPAILWSSAFSWSNDCNEEQLVSALNTFVFRDKKQQLGSLILEMGRYVNFEERALECRTLAPLPLQFPNARGEKFLDIEQGLIQLTLSLIPQDLREIYQEKMISRHGFDLEGFTGYIKKLHKCLIDSNPECFDALLIREEILNTLLLLETLQHARILLSKQSGSKQLASSLKDIALDFERLFLIRNRPSGLHTILDKMNNLVKNLLIE